MPVYTYKCSNCHNVFDDITTVEDRNNTKRCSECAGYGERVDIGTENVGASGVNGLMKENLRWSDSLGCTELDFPRMQKLHPGSIWRKRPSGGYQMGIRNRQEKLQRMNEAGMKEL